MSQRVLMIPLILALGLCAPALLAQDAAPVEGADTRVWLDLQTNGSAASPVARPMPGEIADRTYERYANSFSIPIPETLDREGFVSESSEGSSSGN